MLVGEETTRADRGGSSVRCQAWLKRPDQSGRTKSPITQATDSATIWRRRDWTCERNRSSFGSGDGLDGSGARTIETTFASATAATSATAVYSQLSSGCSFRSTMVAANI